MSPNRTTRRRSRPTVIGTLGTAVLLLAAPLAVFVVAVFLAGWHLGIVRTGSMEPVLATGALIVASPISAEEVEAGMIVEFIDPADRSRVITHRVVEINRDPDTGATTFTTRGDANAQVDSRPVPPENIRSEVRWQVPGLGALLWKLRWPYSLVLLIVPAGLVLIGSLVNRPQGDADGDGEDGHEDPTLLDCISCPARVEPGFRYCPSCGIRQRPVVASPLGDAVDTASGVDLTTG